MGSITVKRGIGALPLPRQTNRDKDAIANFGLSRFRDLAVDLCISKLAAATKGTLSYALLYGSEPASPRSFGSSSPGSGAVRDFTGLGGGACHAFRFAPTRS